jgi:CHAD domain-containing protein
MASGRNGNVETELQFEAPDLHWVERWLATCRRDDIRLEPQDTAYQEDEYLDSESFVIYRAGFALRLRRAEGRPTVATLKALTPQEGGLARRRELEQELTDEASWLSMTGPVSDRARLLLRDAGLRQLFVVKTNRRPFAVEARETEIAELVLDQSVFPRERFGDIWLQRVEVEQKHDGGLDDARGFIDALVAACGLSVARTSKFEAGLQAHGIVPATTPYLGPTQTSPTDTARAYGLAKMRAQFGEFLRNEPGARLGESADAVHDMRVATRRLRAAISTFHTALPEEFQRLSRELRWFGRALGEVRDLDVHIEAMEKAKLGALSTPAGKQALVEKLQAQRAGARSRLVDALGSRRFDALVAGMSQALGQDGTAPYEQQMPVTQHAPERIRHRFRKFRQVARDSSAESAPEELHEVRIRAKRLRFTLEFFEELYDKDARRLIDAAIDVQDCLGEHQDLHVLNERLGHIVRAYGRELEPEALVLAGALMQRNESRAEAIRAGWKDGPRDVFKRWRRFKDELDTLADEAEKDTSANLESAEAG